MAARSSPGRTAGSRGRTASRDDWRWQLGHAIETVAELARHLDLSREEREGALRAERQGLRLRITPYYLSLCDPHDPSCPIRRQVVPRSEETRAVPGDMVDPLGERAHRVAARLIRRYPDRALLLASAQCAVHCRFCTRSRLVGRRRDSPAPAGFEPAMRYLAQHPEIREVIVSGGDPLLLATDHLAALCARLRRIAHIEVLRLATRVPAALPSRVTAELVRALRRYHPIWVMTHFNHPRELTAAAEQACRRLVDAGFPVMNQTVLLRGVNDRASVLASLFRGLVRWRVRPYYFFQMDPVRGAAHLRTPLAAGVELMAALQGKLSGIALPKLVVDTPGGGGKVPLGPCYAVASAAGQTRLRPPGGASVAYVDPPA
ncbi:MAG: KamA family radical SAM protein [Deltaproteobacteria bacterium]|nr:KamA family radical SAM protein [Deltaproteobacteria bacterium]